MKAGFLHKINRFKITISVHFILLLSLVLIWGSLFIFHKTSAPQTAQNKHSDSLVVQSGNNDTGATTWAPVKENNESENEEESEGNSSDEFHFSSFDFSSLILNFISGNYPSAQLNYFLSGQNIWLSIKSIRI